MFVLSATVSRPLPKGFDIFFQGENLTNNAYNIGRTPVVTIGQPILVRWRFRWQEQEIRNEWIVGSNAPKSSCAAAT